MKASLFKRRFALAPATSALLAESMLDNAALKDLLGGWVISGS